MTHNTKGKAPKRLRQAAARSRKCRRIPTDQLEPTIRGSIDPIDEMVMRRLRDSLRGLSDAPVSALLERKLVPHKISSALLTAEVLSRWLVIARAAQMITGIPASILIAEITCGANDAFSDQAIAGNDFFRHGKSFASLGAAVLDHASYLANEPKFQSVMRAKDNPTEYVAAIAACKLWDAQNSQDRADCIVETCLVECDALPIQQLFQAA
jgi:hypothetical protein